MTVEILMDLVLRYVCSDQSKFSLSIVSSIVGILTQISSYTYTEVPKEFNKTYRFYIRT